MSAHCDFVFPCPFSEEVSTTTHDGRRGRGKADGGAKPAIGSCTSIHPSIHISMHLSHPSTATPPPLSTQGEVGHRGCREKGRQRAGPVGFRRRTETQLWETDKEGEGEGEGEGGMSVSLLSQDRDESLQLGALALRNIFPSTNRRWRRRSHRRVGVWPTMQNRYMIEYKIVCCGG